MVDRMHLSHQVKMMNSKTKKITSLILILGVSSLQAGTIRSQGTAGASQLLIPVGAENIAQGGSNTATSTGVDALYVNPAGTSGISGAQVTVCLLYTSPSPRDLG